MIISVGSRAHMLLTNLQDVELTFKVVCGQHTKFTNHRLVRPAV